MSQTWLQWIFWCCLGATAYTYLVYPLLLGGAAWLCRRPSERRSQAGGEPAANDCCPTVTMVISAYNEQEVLPEKIANCLALEYPPDKLRFLIGSDGSTDATGQILAAIDDPRFVTVCQRQRAGKVRMLNRLLELATGQIVVFSDANTMYQPDALRQLVGGFRADAVGVVIGKLELTAPPAAPDACRTEGLYWRYENRLKHWESRWQAVPTITGAIFAIRRALFEPLPEQAVTEDQVLGMRIMARGHRSVFVAEARAAERVSSWQGEWKRRIRISAGNFQSLLLVPRILSPARGRIWFTFVSHKLLRWLVPFFLVAILAANLGLTSRGLYAGTLLCQGAFYAAGLLGAVLSGLGSVTQRRLAARILSVPRYFLVMNGAILAGWLRFVLRRQRVTWAKSR